MMPAGTADRGSTATPATARTPTPSMVRCGALAPTLSMLSCGAPSASIGNTALVDSMRCRATMHAPSSSAAGSSGSNPWARSA
jgi:hypothetical protein